MAITDTQCQRAESEVSEAKAAGQTSGGSTALVHDLIEPVHAHDYLGKHSMVRAGGLEPPRPFGQWHLKPSRMPFRHARKR